MVVVGRIVVVVVGVCAVVVGVCAVVVVGVATGPVDVVVVSAVPPQAARSKTTPTAAIVIRVIRGPRNKRTQRVSGSGCKRARETGILPSVLENPGSAVL